MNLAGTQDRQDQARQTGAAAQVQYHPRPTCRRRRQEGHQLAGVQDMPAPDVFEAVATDQIDPSVPFPEQGDVGVEPDQCFT